MNMKYLIEDFIVSPGQHCFYSSLYNIFRYMGIPLLEHELFVLCDGLTFQVQLQSSRLFFDFILDAIRVDYTNQIQTLGNRIQIGYNIFQDIGSLVESLKRGIPVLAFVKAKALKYNIVENPRDNLGAHGIVIYGIDTNKQLVYVADSYLLDYENNISASKKTLRIQDIETYLISYCSFSSGRVSIDHGTIKEAYCENINRYLSNSWNNGEQAALYLVDHLQIWNEGKEHANANQSNYITLIFLMKAYFLNILYYIHRLNRQYINGFSESDELIHEIRINLNAFFLRCLSKVGSTDDIDAYMVSSGKKAIKLYSSLLRKTQTKLRSINEN